MKPRHDVPVRLWTLAAGLVLAALLATALSGTSFAELPAGLQVDQKEVCGNCHDLSDELRARVTHQPAAAGECSACHNPHVSRFDALLRDRPGPLCGECHAEVAAELAAPVVHQPVAEGRCAECHEPHGSSHSGLLRASGAELCATCHEPVKEWSVRPVQHVPFAQGNCDACHEPHAGEVPGLLTARGAGVCTSCHDTGGAFRAAHSGYPVERAECQQCHDPHASERRGLFRASMHEPFASGDCSTCHQAPGAADPFATVAPLDELCGMCHEAAVEANRDAPFPHVGAGGGGCVACHNPHSGAGAALLREEQETLCLSCHDPAGSSSGLEGRHPSHGEGALECTTCHAPHGGERPVLMASDPIALCGECHSHQHQEAHPLGEEVRDPRNGAPMDCVSCHGIHDAPYEFYLHKSGERDLCLSCHKDIGGGR
jgi:predicted CXXCH cytochrome family protein